MKKVIILCSALVFGFLTSSEASAKIDVNSVTYVNAKSAVEEIFTELLNVAGKEALQKRHQEFSVLVISNSAKGWKIGWRGKKDISIENDGQGNFTVKFKDPKSQVHPFGVDRIKNFLKSVQAEIDQYKATRNNKQQVLNELQSRGSSRVSSRRNSVSDLIEKFEQNDRRSLHRVPSVDSINRSTRSSYRSNSIDGIDKQNVRVNVDQFRSYNATPSRRSSVKDLARRFENGADEYVEDYYSKGLSSNGSTQNSRVPSRRSSTINGVPVFDEGRYASIDEGGDASLFEVKEGATLGEKTAERINQLRNSASNSRRSSVSNLSSRRNSINNTYIDDDTANMLTSYWEKNGTEPSRRVKKLTEGNGRQLKRSESADNINRAVNQPTLHRAGSESNIAYVKDITFGNATPYFSKKLDYLRDLMSEKERIPANSVAYLSLEDINNIEEGLVVKLSQKDSSWNRKIYSRNELKSYIEEATINYLRSKKPAVDLPKNIDKLDENKQKDQIKAKQLIENMLTSTYKYFLDYDPKRQHKTWQSSGAESGIKEIVRLLGERLRSAGRSIGSTNVIINKGWRNSSVKFESKDAEKWVGNANAIKLLYKIIHEKETELRMTYIMDELIEYENELDNANSSNDSLSTSSSTSRRNSTSTNASNDSLSTYSSDYDNYIL